MKQQYIFGAVVILLVGGALLLTYSSDNQSSNVSNLSTEQAVVYKFTISGYSYEPKSIDVNLGDTVTLKIKNLDQVTHGINLPVFGIQEFVRPGQTQTVTFVADQKGDPELFCSSDHGEKLLINVQ
ncbi:cupredoxin domain-containing protein [Patescibacteria group bacterium]|nr:cupredoxin domain-containing protein [Patescibacteria group bacterium]